jgi:hypothetical protein
LSTKLIFRTTHNEDWLIRDEGVDVLARYRQIVDELKAYPELLTFLTEPVKNREEGYINWYVGKNENPVHFEDLPPEGRQEAEEQLKSAKELYFQVADKFSRANLYKLRQVSKFMVQALSEPGVLSYLKLNGGRVAVLCWGLKKADSLVFESEEPYVPEPEPVAPPPPPPLPPPPPPVVYIPPPPPPPPPPPKPKEPINFWRIIVGLLVGGLLGFILTAILLCILKPEILDYLRQAIRPYKAGNLKEDELASLRLELLELRSRYFTGRNNCIILPEGPGEGNFGFVHGCYAAEEGEFYEALSGETSTFAFCHDENKKLSEFYIVMGSSPNQRVCKTSVSPSWDGDNAVFKSDGPAACQENDFPAFVVNCAPGEPPGTEASCSILEANAQGSYYMPIPLKLRREWAN